MNTRMQSAGPPPASSSPSPPPPLALSACTRLSALPVAVAIRAGAIAANFALTLVVARQLDIASAGLFFLTFTITNVAATVGRFGTDNLALKLVAAPGPHVRSEVRYCLTICTAASSAVAVVCLPVLHFGLNMTMAQETGATTALAAMSAAVPLLALSVLAGAILRGIGRPVSGTMAELGLTPLIATLGVAVVGSETSLGQVVAIYILAAWLTGAISVPFAWLCLRKNGSTLPPGRAIGTFVRDRRGQLASMMGSSALFYLLIWSPVLTLGFASSPHQVALYTTAARIAAFVSLIPAIQAAHLAPKFAESFHRGTVSELNRLSRASTRRASLIALAPAGVLTTFPEYALRLFGSEFSSAAAPLRLLATGVLITVALGQVNQLMLICDLERTALTLNLALLGIVSISSVVVGSFHGALGVALVSATASVVYAVVAAIFLAGRSIHSGVIPLCCREEL